MKDDQLAREFVRMLFQPKLLVGAAAFVVLSALFGYLSLRILRRLADFEQKREMVSGARWAWAGALLVVAVAYATACLGVMLTRYPVTSALSGAILLFVCLALFSGVFPRQANGAMFVFFAAGQRIRRKEVSAASWIEAVARRRGLAWYYKAAGPVLLVMTLLCWAVVVLTLTCPLDAELARWEAGHRTADAVAHAVRLGISQDSIQDLSAFGPHPEVDPLLDVGSTKQIAKSFREILRLGQPEDRLFPGNFHLFIRVTKETTDRQARDILAQAQKVLADRRESHRWRIAVYSRESKLSVHGLYPPTEGEE